MLSNMFLLLNKGNQHDDKNTRTAKKTFNDRKTYHGAKNNDDTWRKISTTLRQIERRKSSTPVFSIEHHLQSSIFGRSRSTSMDANVKDNPLKHVINRSLKALRRDFTSSKITRGTQSALQFSPPLQSVRKTIHTPDVQVYRDLVGPVLGSSYRSETAVLQNPHGKSPTVLQDISISMDMEINCD